jgi:hypothetical protein
METTPEITEKIMNTYKTSDLYLSAFLKAKGMRLTDTINNGGRFVFILDDREDRNQLIQEFFNEGLVSITAVRLQT